ncbi:dihydroxy-acid dehydratase [Chloropicon primus]|nr:dihydroxy-acid dehydratase [Chloropicon primus]
MAHRLLRDREAEGWESAEFPIVCETCLGPNPYLRMTRAEFDKECKICTRPFTVFRWRPGQDARCKKTEICQTCARAKNVCQTCVLDLDYQVPVQVRDHALGEEATRLPQSEVNREYYVQNLEKSIASGEFDAQNKNRARPSELLSQLQRSGPMYHRNKAKICSFFVKGCCNRGSECPFRHELPQEVYKDESLAKQNIKDRYHGVNDPVAAKMISRARGMPSLLDFPEDVTICTMYVGGIPEGGLVSEQDLLDHFYAFGEVKAIRKSEAKRCAFVTLATRAMAEEAARSHAQTGLHVKGHKLRLMWGRPRKEGGGGERGGEGRGGSSKRERPQQQQQQQQQVGGGGANVPYPSMDPMAMGASKRKRPRGGGGEGEEEDQSNKN